MGELVERELAREGVVDANGYAALTSIGA